MVVDNFCKIIDCVWESVYGLSINKNGEFMCDHKRRPYLGSSDCPFVSREGKLKSVNYQKIKVKAELIKVISVLEMDKKKLLSHEEK